MQHRTSPRSVPQAHLSHAAASSQVHPSAPAASQRFSAAQEEGLTRCFSLRFPRRYKCVSGASINHGPQFDLHLLELLRRDDGPKGLASSPRLVERSFWVGEGARTTRSNDGLVERAARERMLEASSDHRCLGLGSRRHLLAHGFHCLWHQLGVPVPAWWGRPMRTRQEQDAHEMDAHAERCRASTDSAPSHHAASNRRC